MKNNVWKYIKKNRLKYNSRWNTPNELKWIYNESWTQDTYQEFGFPKMLKPYKRIFYSSKKYFDFNINNDAVLALLYEDCTEVNGTFLFDYFKEAVINVENEKNTIVSIVKNVFEKNAHKKINVLLPIIEDKIYKHKIKFKYNHTNAPKYITVADYVSKTDIINLSCTNKILEDESKNEHNIFVNEFENLLGHELVHRQELIKIKNREIFDKLLKSDIGKRREYYSNKYELMAYAWQIVNNFRMHGMSDINIKIMLAATSTIKLKYGGLVLDDYHKYFTREDKTLKLLYKYMFLYLEL